MHTFLTSKAVVFKFICTMFEDLLCEVPTHENRLLVVRVIEKNPSRIRNS